MNLPPFVWLIAFPLLAAPLVYLIGRAAKNRASMASRVAFGALALAWIPFVAAARAFLANGAAEFVSGTITLRFDGVSLLVTALALGLGTIVAFYSIAYMARDESHEALLLRGDTPPGSTGAAQEKFHALLVMLVGVMCGAACAADLFNLWVWFEAMAVVSYLLVAFYRERPASLEAGIKYLVQSATGSALILLGIALVLSQTGTLDLDSIRAALQGKPIDSPLLAAGALFVSGFGVKAALVPMHTWLPDAHAEAPSGISALLSGIVIQVSLVALLRVLSCLFVGGGTGLSWGVLLMGLGAVNMLAGNLLALRQVRVKRLLAFSTVAQAGYILLGLGIGIYTGEVAGAAGGFFHLLNHGLMKGLAFLAAGALLYALHTAGDPRPLTIPDLGGAAQRYPLTALALSIAALGLAGLPPLAGFMSKWQIFVSGFATHNLWIEALVVFAGLNSVLSLAYYAPLVNAVYRQRPSPAVLEGQPLPFTLRAPLALLAIAIVAIGIYPGMLAWLTQPAGAAVLSAFGR